MAHALVPLCGGAIFYRYREANPEQFVARWQFVQVAHLGDGGDDARKLREKDRDAFIPGKFICPHGACFDPDGNIFVVEFVEVGRVTKLRKVA